MSEQLHSYPDHISEPMRIDVATSILEKEYRKIFLDVPAEAWSSIDRSIRGWAEHPADYHFAPDSLLDFWDSFAAIMESIKLKPGFTPWLTAENVTWAKVWLQVRDIHMTRPLDQVSKVPDLDVRHGLSFGEYIDALVRDQTAAAEQKTIIDQHSTDPDQDRYPILAHKTTDGPLTVIDGNRRTLRAAIYGQEHIEAWVGELSGTEPVNFWIPINDMLQLLEVYKRSLAQNNEAGQHAAACILKSHFALSAVAEYAYQTRISRYDDTARQLYEKVIGRC